jgi:membrane protein YqaA with SNARE-associated domain
LPASPAELLIHPESVGRAVHLRWWFLFFALWLAGLTLLLRADAFGLSLDFSVRLVVFLTLYLSVACTFVPLPTTPLVAWAAMETLQLDKLSQLPRFVQNAVAWLLGPVPANATLAADPVVRVLLIAVFGAAATMLANLNDYYIVTALLRHRKIAAVRDTRLYRTATRWFSRWAWLTVYAFALIPIPIDVVRLLAITYRYPRWRFAAACLAGRFTRYFLLAWLVAKLLQDRPGEQWFVVLAITVLTVGAGLTIGVRRIMIFLKRRRELRVSD